METYTLEPANYLDYRDFFKARFQKLKKEKEFFSLMYCSKKSNISRSLLQFLFKKERHISLDKYPELASTLELTDDEEYFTYFLICKNSASHEKVIHHFEKILQRLRSQYLNISEPEPDFSKVEENEFFHNNLLMIIQTLLRLKGSKKDSHWIQEHLLTPTLSEEKIKETIQLLEKNNHDEFNFHKPDPTNNKGFNIYSEAIQFLSWLMKEPNNYCPSKYSFMSLAMDEENLKKTEELFVETHHKICSFAKESHEPNSVVYLSNYFLTLLRLNPNKHREL